MRGSWQVCGALALCGAALGADVPIVKAGASKTPIDVTRLDCGGSDASRLFLKTLEGDLVRSGWFDLSTRGSGILVSGSGAVNGGALAVSCTVANGLNGQKYLAKSWQDAVAASRSLAHRVADEIVRAVKGVNGMAGSRIAMIGGSGKAKDLYVCDADGGNLVRLTKDAAPCLAPNWGPDGQTLTYTSFVAGFPDAYRIDLRTNRRERLAAYPGINMGARISPDGSSVALTLSKDGNPDLYLIAMGSGKLTRITRTPYAAEASPTWSPDGRELAFVADGSGSPHVYIMPSSGGKATRVTFQGSEDVAPDWGPDGRIAYASKRSGFFQVCILDANTHRDTQLTQTALDSEDPSWAPDARHLVCSRNEGRRRSLYVLDTLGDPPVRLLSVQTGEVYSPAWSPK